MHFVHENECLLHFKWRNWHTNHFLYLKCILFEFVSWDTVWQSKNHTPDISIRISGGFRVLIPIVFRLTYNFLFFQIMCHHSTNLPDPSQTASVACHFMESAAQRKQSLFQIRFVSLLLQRVTDLKVTFDFQLNYKCCNILSKITLNFAFSRIGKEQTLIYNLHSPP